MRVLIGLLLICISVAAQGSDPYESLVRFELNNGMSVYLAPSPAAKLMRIKVEVDVGWESEDKNNFGVSHLLEHVLFRDKRLKDNMSYLQLIRENGGEANGVTSDRRTSYFATIPHKKGLWLQSMFHRMLATQGELLDTYVQKEKETVLREIGEPTALNRALGVDLWNLVRIKYLKLPSFWESEFGVTFDSPFTREQERLSTLQLTQKQVNKQYTDYYYPANMKLFVSGRFDVAQMKKFIETTWGKVPRREGKKLKPIKDPQPRKAPYYQIKVAGSDPYVSLGTKLWGVSLNEELALETYMEYLAHRLTKEIRNLHGYTYHVDHDVTLYKNYGYAHIGFYTKKEEFEDNRKLLEEFIKKEAQKGGLTQAQVNEAKQLRIRYYEATDSDAESMMWVAEDAQGVKETYDVVDSPYAMLKSLSVTDFNNTLKKYFKPQRRYTYHEKPPIFFSFDYLLLYLIVFAVAFRQYRKWLTKKFDHCNVRWVRKIQYLPFKGNEFWATFAAIVLYAHAQYMMELVFSKIPFLQASLIASQYLFWSLCVAIMALVIQGVYAFVPKKLMIVGDRLYVKSMTYYSYAIPLSQIEKVHARSIMTFPLPWKLWRKVKWRVYFFDLFFWRKGLFIETKDGRAFVFSFRNSEKVAEELSGFLEKEAPLHPVQESA